MNWFEQLLYTMHSQKIYLGDILIFSWFIILVDVLVILSVVAMAFFLKPQSDLVVKTVLLIYSISCIVLEIAKQIYFSFHTIEINGIITPYWEYNWAQFPFQFCATPMYIALIAALSKKGRYQNALYTFLATYGSFAGFLCILIPSSIISDNLWTTLHTFYHHSSQFLIGVFLVRAGRAKFSKEAFVDGSGVFFALLSLALFLDTVIHLFITNGTSQIINLWFISAFEPCNWMGFSWLYDGKTYILWPILIMLYVSGFFLASWLIYLVTHPSEALKKL